MEDHPERQERATNIDIPKTSDECASDEIINQALETIHQEIYLENLEKKMRPFIMRI